MLTRRPSVKLSRLAGTRLASPEVRSQHDPVHPNAIGLHTVKGASTLISISAVTMALVAAISLSSSKTRFCQQKTFAGIGGIDLRDAKVDGIGIGKG